MGVLDDAIREHLELRRRHGAGEDELRRQEAEALGPARRESAVVEPEGALGGVAGRDEAPFAEPEAAPFEPITGREPFDERVADEVPAEESLDTRAAEPLGPQTVEAGAAVDADREAQALDEEELAEEELAAELAGDEVVEEELADDLPPEEPAGHLLPEEEAEDLPPEEETEGLSPEEAEDLPPEEPAGSEQADEDLLEETPEFLQETPEHERLWFEQRPPRDFDLDR